MTSKVPLNLNNPGTVNDIDEQFLEEVQNKILHISFEDKFFESTSRYARMTSLKFSKFNFSAAISNIYAQFVPVGRGLYSAYFTFQQLF